MFQVKEVSIFLCMGRQKSLGSLKSFHSYASRLYGASILYFQMLTSWCHTIGSGHSMILQLFSFLSALEGWNWWCLWLPCLLTWQEILHFSKEHICLFDLLSEAFKIASQILSLYKFIFSWCIIIFCAVGAQNNKGGKTSVEAKMSNSWG